MFQAIEAMLNVSTSAAESSVTAAVDLLQPAMTPAPATIEHATRSARMSHLLPSHRAYEQSRGGVTAPISDLDPAPARATFVSVRDRAGGIKQALVSFGDSCASCGPACYLLHAERVEPIPAAPTTKSGYGAQTFLLQLPEQHWSSCAQPEPFGRHVHAPLLQKLLQHWVP
jgi:hypothetical protein